MEHIHNPEYIGPGWWCVIHLAAAKSTNDEQKDFFEYLVELTLKTYTCKKCRTHFQQLILENPLQKYRNKVEGYFKWSYLVHNIVNESIGKPVMSYEEAKNLYYTEAGVCTKDCGVVENKDDEVVNVQKAGKMEVAVYRFTVKP
jgi:hypothetical protein